MNRARLLIVTAKECGACVRFKADVLDDLLKKLEKVNCVVRHADLNSFSSADLINAVPDYPATVQKYVGWFPTLLLFPPNSWEPEIFNGKISGGKPQMNREIPYTSVDISSWVEKTIASDPRFTQNKGKGRAGSARYVLVENGKPITNLPRGPRFLRREYPS